MPKKKKENVMGSYACTEYERDAHHWGLRNNIFITPVATTAGNPTHWYLEIEVNGKTYKSPESFEPIEIWKKLYEYYIYYFEKYRK